MLETLGIVQLMRNGDEESTSRVEDFSKRYLAGRGILEWVVRRVTDAQRLDGVIVLMNDPLQYDAWAEQIPADVPVFLSAGSDPLASTVAAIDEFPCQSVVLCSIDTPFVDPTLIDRLVITAQSHPECDYIGYCQRDGRPSVLSQVGVFAEWCRSRALREAHRKAEHPADRRSATRFLHSHPERFQLRLMTPPPALDRDDVRLRISCEEDWDNVSTIAETIGEEALEWQCVAGVLDTQPALRERMATLNKIAKPVD
jgi:spore coat polysaccharide biosynthesis protein SpsF